MRLQKWHNRYNNANNHGQLNSLHQQPCCVYGTLLLGTSGYLLLTMPSWMCNFSQFSGTNSWQSIHFWFSVFQKLMKWHPFITQSSNDPTSSCWWHKCLTVLTGCLCVSSCNRLLMKSITTLSGIFEGRADALTFTHSVRLLTDNLYRTAGRWTAMSLTQVGPGPQCMAEAVYRYWTGLPVGNEHLSIDLIVDVDMRQRIQQVCDICNTDQRDCQFLFLLYWNVIAGFSGREQFESFVLTLLTNFN